MTTSGTVLLQSAESPSCTTGLCAQALDYFSKRNVRAHVVANITAYIDSLKFSEASEFNREHRVALQFGASDASITASFNGQYYHTPSIALRTASAIVLANATVSSAFNDLLVSNYPLGETTRQIAQAGKPPSAKASMWGTMNMLAQVRERAHQSP